MSKDKIISCTDCGGNGYIFNDFVDDVCKVCDGLGRKKLIISEEELNILTLKICEVIFKEGYEEVKWNESHNVIRGCLARHFFQDWLSFEPNMLNHISWGELRKKYNLFNPFESK